MNSEILLNLEIAMVDEVQALVCFYFRLGYGHHVQDICSQHIRQQPQECVLQFWHACGVMLEGSISEAVRDLWKLNGNVELEVGVVAALLYCETAAIGIDGPASNLLQRLEEVEQTASERALLLAATLYSLLGRAYELQKAMEWVLRVLKVQPQNAQALCVKGWVELQSWCKGTVYWATAETAADTFRGVLVRGNNLEASLGMARYYELKGNYLKAVNEMNKVFVLCPWFLPALAEKGRLAFLLRDLDSVMEIAQLLLQKDPGNLDGLRLVVHVTLCSKNSVCMAAELVADLGNCIMQREPKNSELLVQVAKPISRLAGRSGQAVIRKTRFMIEQAVSLNREKASYVLEMAEQQFLLGEFDAALCSYRLASQMNCLDLEASYGVVQCLLIQEEVKEAELQLQLMVEISVSMGRSCSLTYLLAQLNWISGEDVKACLDLLDETFNLHKQGVPKKFDYEYFTDLNMDRLFGIAYLYLSLSGAASQEVKTYALGQAAHVLEYLNNAIPSSVGGHLMLAHVMFKLGKLGSTLDSLEYLLRLDSSCASGHLLLAQVYMCENKYELAKQSLEEALSNDFAVRDTIDYLVIHAKVLMSTMDFTAAKKALEHALLLSESEVKRGQLMYYKYPGTMKHLNMMGDDTAHIFMLLIDLDLKFGMIEEATMTIQRAKPFFEGTSDREQLLLATSDLAMIQANIKGGLQILQQVSSNSNHYIQARLIMAEIYLKYQNDKAMFINCYLEVVDKFYNSQMLILLSDAFMKINAPERAILSYQIAIEQGLEDPLLATKVAVAFVSMHEYKKTIVQYEAILKTTSHGFVKYGIQYELSDLQVALKNYEYAKNILITLLKELESEFESSKLGMVESQKFLSLCVKSSLLLLRIINMEDQNKVRANVCRLFNELLFIHDVSYAMQFLDMIIEKLRFHIKSSLHSSTYAKICVQLSQECEVQSYLDKIILLLHEALNYNPQDAELSIALSKIHFERSEIVESEGWCLKALSANPFDAKAKFILAQVMLSKRQYQCAIMHFKQILETQPNDYISLAQLVQLYRKVDQLESVLPYLNRTHGLSSKSHTHTGLQYCRGLYARYSNNPSKALQILNTSRSDPYWGKHIIYMMIELYLNIDEFFSWERINSRCNWQNHTQGIKAASRLLVETRKIGPYTAKQIVFECYTKMATGVKKDVEYALGQLNLIKDNHLGNVSILLAMAIAFNLLSQSVKAKNQLRQILKLEYKWEDADDFERAWLMLASLYVQAQKYDLAEELCTRCLEYNGSCARALKYLGLIKEKIYAHAESIKFYGKSLRYYKGLSPMVGYQLAFNYVKDRHMIPAISICNKIRKAYSGHQKMKQELIDKARSHIRA